MGREVVFTSHILAGGGMNKPREFYRKVFSMIHIAFGYMPFPASYMENEAGKDMVLKLWDSKLGVYNDNVIIEAIELCMDSEERTPNLAKILQYVKTVEKERRFAIQNKQFESGRFDCD